MKSRCAVLLVLVLALSMLLTQCGTTPAPQKVVETVVVTQAPPVQEGPLEIAFIVKSTTDPFWLYAIEGGKAAAAELGVNLTVLAPKDETNVSEQVAIVEDAVQKGVDGIVLAPSDSNALVGAVEKANAANIPVATIDTAVNGGKPLTFTATDNVKGAMMAADLLGQLMGGRGKVAALACTQTVSTCRDLLAGFIGGLEKYPDIQIVGWPLVVPFCDKAFNATQDLITANPDMTGLFVFGGDSNTCAAEAAKAAGKTLGKDFFIVGRNAGEAELKAVKNGDLMATVAQYPGNMGKIGVQSIVDFYAGKTVPNFVDSGVDLVTPENVDEFLNP